jgi:hypothetical protein
MSIVAKAEESPEIQPLVFNASTNTLTVTWLTTIADIVYIVVIVKDVDNTNEFSVVVGPNERTVEVAVDPVTYNVTVVVFDICKNNYSSIPETVGVRVESSSASLFGTTVTLQSTPSPLTTFEETTSPSHFPTPRSRHTMSSPHMSSFDTSEPSMQCIQGNAGKDSTAAVALGIVLVLSTIIFSMILLILLLVWLIQKRE